MRTSTTASVAIATGLSFVPVPSPTRTGGIGAGAIVHSFEDAVRRPIRRGLAGTILSTADQWPRPIWPGRDPPSSPSLRKDRGCFRALGAVTLATCNPSHPRTLRSRVAQPARLWLRTAVSFRQNLGRLSGGAPFLCLPPPGAIPTRVTACRVAAHRPTLAYALRGKSSSRTRLQPAALGGGARRPCRATPPCEVPHAFPLPVPPIWPRPLPMRLLRA